MADRANDLIRHELLRRLPDPTDRLIVVLTAPAGWGKTTVLNAWSNTMPDVGSCRLALTPADDDPRRFLDRFEAAAQPLLGPIDGGSAANSSPAVWVEDVLPLVRRQFDAVGPALIVLDDYHIVTQPDIHQIVQALVDELPAQTSLVLSTRGDPPLRLARLRAARRVVEWRAEDLAFTVDDTAELLRQGFGLQLGDRELDLLTTRTEGWPAAISLAALALPRVDDVETFLDNFLAVDQYLVDYVTEELLGVVPAEQRSFLVRTSVVERFTVELACRLADTGRGGELCDELERRGLLTRDLDEGRAWFRYHQLIRDHLYHQASAVDRANLHLTAADWFLAEDLPRAAIDQLIAGGHHQRANEMVGRYGSSYIIAGRTATVVGWVEALRRVDAIEPRTLLLGAQAAFYGGDRARGRAWLAEATEHELAGPAEWAVALSLRATVANADGLIADAARWANRLTELLDEHGDDSSIPIDDRAEGYFVAGHTLLFADDEPVAMEALERSLAISRSPVVTLPPAVAALGMQAFVAYLQQDLATARSLVDQAFAIADQLDLAHTSMHMRAPVLMRLAIGNEAEAGDLLADVHRFELSYSAYSIATAHLIEARYHARRRDQDAAVAAFGVARDLLDEVAQPSPSIERFYDEIASELTIGAAPTSPEPEALTDRELQVLRAFSSNLTQREIGRELFLSFNTIKTYARSAYRKLGVSSRTEAVHACRELGLF